MDELGAVIGGKIKAKSKILLTDACHSGAITPEDTESLNNRLGDLSKSLFSLTASRARERSFESRRPQGRPRRLHLLRRRRAWKAPPTPPAMAWSPPTNSPSTSTPRCASTPPTARTPPPTRPTTIPKCSWPTFRPKPSPPPPPPPNSAPSSSIPTWMASKSSSTARPSASSKKASPSALPDSLPASTPCRASRWATSPMDRARKWSTPARNPPSASAS